MLRLLKAVFRGFFPTKRASQVRSQGAGGGEVLEPQRPVKEEVAAELSVEASAVKPTRSGRPKKASTASQAPKASKPRAPRKPAKPKQ